MNQACWNTRCGHERNQTHVMDNLAFWMGPDPTIDGLEALRLSVTAAAFRFICFMHRFAWQTSSACRRATGIRRPVARISEDPKPGPAAGAVLIWGTMEGESAHSLVGMDRPRAAARVIPAQSSNLNRPGLRRLQARQCGSLARPGKPPVAGLALRSADRCLVKRPAGVYICIARMTRAYGELSTP